jgi:hypothetical protein
MVSWFMIMSQWGLLHLLHDLIGQRSLACHVWKLDKLLQSTQIKRKFQESILSKKYIVLPMVQRMNKQIIEYYIILSCHFAFVPFTDQIPHLEQRHVVRLSGILLRLKSKMDWERFFILLSDWRSFYYGVSIPDLIYHNLMIHEVHIWPFLGLTENKGHIVYRYNIVTINEIKVFDWVSLTTKGHHRTLSNLRFGPLWPLKKLALGWLPMVSPPV